MKIRLDNGKVFEVAANNCSAENKYIQSATLNGKKWNQNWFWHEDLIKVGKLVLQMGNRPNYDWGTISPDGKLSAESLLQRLPVKIKKNCYRFAGDALKIMSIIDTLLHRKIQI